MESPICGPYPIHGPARLAFKMEGKCERKCGLIFEFWKIRSKGGTVLFGVATYFSFLFYEGEKPSKNKKTPKDSMLGKKSGPRKLESRSGDQITYREGTSCEVAPL